MSCLPEIKKSKILIAMTDEKLIKRYRHNLNLFGYDVVIAHDGIDVLRCIYSHWPDIVIIDPQLPQLTGEETCRILKFDSATRHIRLLWIEPENNSHSHRTESQFEIDEVISRDIDQFALLSIIHEQVQKRNPQLSPAYRDGKRLSEIDILKRISRILEYKLLEKNVINLINKHANNIENPDELIEQIFKLLGATIPYDILAIYMADSKELLIDRTSNADDVFIEHIMCSVQKTCEFNYSKLKLSFFCHKHAGNAVEQDEPSRETVIIKKLYSKNNYIGALIVSRKTGEPFSAFEQDLIISLNDLLTTIIDNIRMTGKIIKLSAELEEIQNQIIHSNAELDRKIEDRTVQLHKFYEAGKLLTTIHDPNRLLATLVDMIINSIGAEVGAALLLENGEISKKIEFGLGFEVIKAIRFKDNGGKPIYQRVLESGEVVILNQQEVDEQLDRDILKDRNLNINALACIPFKTATSVIGTMMVINKLFCDSFSPDDIVALTTLASMATVAIENATLYQQTIQKTKLEADMKIAMEMQMELLPKEPPESEVFEVASMYTPAEMIGGDYYDYISIDADNTGFIVADVTGHGVSAAFIMTLVKTCAQLSSIGIVSTKEVVQALNAFLFKNIPRNNFVSMLYAIVNTRERMLHYTSAGHNPSMRYCAQEDEFIAITTDGLFLSLFEKTDYGEIVIPLQKGDIYLFYTDGLTEATNNQKEFLGMHRIQQVIRENKDKSAQEISSILFWYLHEYIGHQPLDDDLTFIVLKIIQ
ncbi:MAG: SpoIIE family protein phosphatase [Candidatus Auribacterota bacterium]|nr:SpoIIE family protein phosphatase [Candidatus Auribacterota bacterium]